MADVYIIELQGDLTQKGRAVVVYTYPTPDEFGGMLATIARENPHLLPDIRLSIDSGAPDA